MKRRVIQRVVVLLLLGAIVNVAVAWGCAWANPRVKFSRWDLLTWRQGWPVEVPSDWGTPHFQGYQISDAGMTVTVLDAYGEHKLLFWRAGVPYKSLSWHSLLNGPTASQGPELFLLSGNPWNDGLDIAKFSGDPNWPVWKRLPIRPLWPGFAINTIFYAAMLWVVFAMPFTLRRRRRIKRGLCPACAYPVGTSPVCTECGKPVSATSVEHL